uniref:ELM2 domain-containing protein n=1 Tax=Syphacia muris TaxID=451379 RepID=A0A0N5B1D3_9BILA
MEPSCSGDNADSERKLNLSASSVGAYNTEIRVGEEYQCDEECLCYRCLSSEKDILKNNYERETCLWKPYTRIDDDKLLAYLSVALMYGIEQDRAMFILMKSGYSIVRAKQNLSRRRIIKKAWCDRDISIFKDCCRIYGKQFQNFNYLLPHKTYAEVIEFYYNNKKLMNFRDLFALAPATNSSSDEKDNELSESCQNDEDVIDDCDNCGIENVKIETVFEMNLCTDCHLHFKFANFAVFKTHRPCIKSLTRIRINSKAMIPTEVKTKVRDFIEFASVDEEEYEPLRTQNNEDDDVQILLSKKRVAERKLR